MKSMSPCLRTTLALTVLLLALADVIIPASSPAALLRTHGSLVITIPTHDGLLVCADKREYNELQGPIDGRMKIFTVGRKTAFAITGVARILDRQTLKTTFDVSAEVL